MELPVICDFGAIVDRENKELKMRHTAACIMNQLEGKAWPTTLESLPSKKDAKSFLASYAPSMISLGSKVWTAFKGAVKGDLEGEFERKIQKHLFDFWRNVPSTGVPYPYKESEAPGLFAEWQQPVHEDGVDISEELIKRCEKTADANESLSLETKIFYKTISRGTYDPETLALTSRQIPETVEAVEGKDFIVCGNVNDQLSRIAPEKFAALKKAAATFYSCHTGEIKPLPEFYLALYKFLKNKYPNLDPHDFTFWESDYSHAELTKQAGFKSVLLPKELEKNAKK